MRLLRQSVFAFLLLLLRVVWASASGESGFSMDVFLVEDGTYELRPRRRRLSESDADCQAVGQCEVCTTGQKEKEPLCKGTGRVQRFKCKPDDGDPRDIFKSCKRTVADDEFLMMQMQVFCFLLGSFSLYAVRKMKTASATLFDQRKNARRGSQYPIPDVEIEFTPMIGQEKDEEMQPLKPIDVV